MSRCVIRVMVSIFDVLGVQRITLPSSGAVDCAVGVFLQRIRCFVMMRPCWSAKRGALESADSSIGVIAVIFPAGCPLGAIFRKSLRPYTAPCRRATARARRSP